MGLMAYRQNAPSSYPCTTRRTTSASTAANYERRLVWCTCRRQEEVPPGEPTSAGDQRLLQRQSALLRQQRQGNAFCYSGTANAAPNASFPAGFNNGENPSSGPWDSYRCFRNKLGSSDSLPTNGATETANGFTTHFGSYNFNPTDSDFAQGILDFGRFMTWNYVGPTWFRNDSPGRGYCTSAGDLNVAKATAIKAALAATCRRPGALHQHRHQERRLTPIEGTLLTARDYFKAPCRPPRGYTASCIAARVVQEKLRRAAD